MQTLDLSRVCSADGRGNEKSKTAAKTWGEKGLCRVSLFLEYFLFVGTSVCFVARNESRDLSAVKCELPGE